MSEKARKLVVSTQCFDHLISLEISIPKSLVAIYVHENCTKSWNCLIAC